jgi:hypothetical protein
MDRALKFSSAATPQAAVAPQDERQRLLVAGRAGVFRQLHLLLNGIPAFALLRGFLDLGRCLLQESQRVLCSLFRAESTACSGVAGDELFPIHCEYFFNRVFPFERIGIDHAAPRQ